MLLSEEIQDEPSHVGPLTRWSRLSGPNFLSGSISGNGFGQGQPRWSALPLKPATGGMRSLHYVHTS